MIQNPERINTGDLFSCPECRTRMRADLFAAFYRPVKQDTAGMPIQVQGQAECFNHPGKQAKTPCVQCGRLLCELCEVELNGRSLCFSCLKSGQEKQREVNLENQRILHDSIALALAILPAFFIFPTIVTAPAAVYVALRYWKRPPAILPRSHWRNIVALLFAGGQITGWILFFIGIFS